MQLGATRRWAWCTLLAAWGVCLLCVRGACAQDVFPTEPLELRRLVALVTDSRVPVARNALTNALSAYFDGYEVLHASADAVLTGVRERARCGPDAYLGVRDTTRACEIRDRACAAHAKLLERFADQLRESVGAEHAEAIDTVRDIAVCLMLSQVSCTSPMPPDIAAWLRPLHAAADGHGAIAAVNGEAQSMLRWQAVNIAGRTRAMQAYIEADTEVQIALAKLAEDLGAVGRTYADMQAEVQAGYQAIERTRPDAATEQAEYERLSKLDEALGSLLGRSEQLLPARRAIVREQWAAFCEIEVDLATARHPADWEAWLMELIDSYSYVPVYVPGISTPDSPRTFVRELLRVSALSDAQREAVRPLAIAFVKESRVRTRARVEGFIAHGAAASGMEEDAVAWMRPHLHAVARAAGLPDLAPAEGYGARLPEGERLDELSADDAREFGAVDAWANRVRDENSRLMFLPIRHNPGLAAQLCERLHVPEATHPIVRALVQDAAATWAARVEPLVVASKPDWGEAGRQGRDWSVVLAEAFECRIKAFAASDACDRELCDQLEAVLGATAPPGHIALTHASFRTPEASVPKWAGLTATPIDIMRAVFDAPVSTESRATLAAELAPEADMWAALAVQVRAARLDELRIWTLAERRGAAAEGPGSAVHKRVVDATARIKRADDAWKAAETAAVERLTALLPGSEQPTWAAWLRHLEWPHFYPAIDTLRAQVAIALGGAENAEHLRARVEPVLESLQQAIKQTGDRCRAIEQKVHSRSSHANEDNDFDSARNEARLRYFPLLSLSTWRIQIAAEQVRQVLPPDRARHITEGAIFTQVATPPAHAR